VVQTGNFITLENKLSMEKEEFTKRRSACSVSEKRSAGIEK
jgi:hypothetical protein